MANRRCFSKDIVCSDDFYDLPISSQALYFHLGMQADDRGYVNNARSIIRVIGSSSGDLEALIQKKFVLVRNSNLILIKGWRINNSIQPSRIVETNYTEDLKTLFFDENNSYTENETNMPCQQFVDKTPTTCRQNADTLSTQYNLIKDNISKDNLNKVNLIEGNLIEDNENNSNKKPLKKKPSNPDTQSLVNLLIDKNYISANSMDEASIKCFVLNELLEKIEIKELEKRINMFLEEIKTIDISEIVNKPIYLKNYLLGKDNDDDELC